MDPNSITALWAPIIATASQFPILTFIAIALQRGWFELGVFTKREREGHVADLVFREGLRQESIAREAAGLLREQALAEQIGSLTEALKEATDVMERSTALSERLVDRAGDGDHSDPPYRDPATRSRGTDRARTRAPRRSSSGG